MELARRLVDQVEERLWPLDDLRRGVYRLLAPVLAPYLADRHTRIAWLSALVLLTSLATSLLIPLPMLALGPLVLGVPHLVADLRYLVLRPGLHRRPGAWVVGALLLATALTRDLSVALLVPVPAALLAQGPWGRRLLAAAPWVAAAVAAVVWTRWTVFAVAQGHNVVAAGIWVLLGGALHGPVRARWPAVVAYLGAAAAIALGAFDPVLAWTTTLHLPGAETLRSHARTVAPFADPVTQARWVVLFAFLQSVHYGLWLRVVPEEARPRPSTRSWLAAFRALRADVTDPLLAVALLLCAGFVVAGSGDLAGARDAYLALAFFHGPLEFAVLTAWFVERRVSAA
jgi:hypothetical protein